MKIDFLGIELIANEEVFRPTLISQYCAENVPFADKDVLDLGCGIGPLAIYFKKNGANSVHGCDVYEKHVELAKKNAKKNNVEINIFLSNLYEKVENNFDVICCDVSGVQSNISEITGWFPSNVPKADSSGANLILKAISGSKKHLRRNGELYVCATSFSDLHLIERELSKNFENHWGTFFKTKIPFSKRLLKNVKSIEKKTYIKENDKYFWEFILFKAKNTIS
tara:strand:- start:919 stop:1590 length:672 start_codon:yes stop_codon:yes gene_type:complete